MRIASAVCASRSSGTLRTAPVRVERRSFEDDGARIAALEELFWALVVVALLLTPVAGVVVTMGGPAITTVYVWVLDNVDESVTFAVKV